MVLTILVISAESMSISTSLNISITSAESNISRLLIAESRDSKFSLTLSNAALILSARLIICMLLIHIP